MPKRVEDIVPTSRRSIRDISKESPPKKIPLTPPPMNKVRSSKHRGWIWFVIIPGATAILAGLGFFISLEFSRATFTLVPRTVSVSINGVYTIKHASNVSLDENILVYEIVSAKSSASTTVPATDGPHLTTKAQGKVTIYNSYSSQPQRLVAGTRISSENGYIYRLTGTVVVPGSKSLSSQMIPGSIEVSVVADAPGSEYNISRSSGGDLRIVAYKGSPKYDGFYVRLASDIGGGYAGVKKIVSPSVMASTTATLSLQLTNALVNKVSSLVPDGYILLDKSYVTNISPVTTSSSSIKNTATVSIQGDIQALIFKKDIFVPFLAGRENISVFRNMPYSVQGLESLKLDIVDPKLFSPTKKNALIAKLQGKFDIIGQIDEKILKNKLAGLPLSQTLSVLESYAPVIIIEKSYGELDPPWSPRVPSDIEHISIFIPKTK